MENKLICKKDFLPLVKGDVVTFYSDFFELWFSLTRKVDSVFCGNKNGKWGRDNPYKRGKKTIIIKEEKYYPHIMRFQFPQLPINKKDHEKSLYSREDWSKICQEKFINNYKELGIF